jgi:thiamine transporter ThiT
MPHGPARLFRLPLAASFALSAALYFVWSWHWPLVGDASLIHYIAFLIQRGWAPYRQLGDMNMPGSFLIELAAMHVFGMNDLAWRLFDFTLLAAASAAFFAICHTTGAPFVTASSSRVGSNNGWLAALFSASLFILIHGRDGLAEGGQRDLTMAVCLLAATAFLFIAVRRNALWAAAAFGLLSGIAATIKPTAILLTLIQAIIALQAARANRSDADGANRSSANSANRSNADSANRSNAAQANVVILSNAKDPRISPRQWIATATAAYLIAPAIAFAFILRWHALSAFLAGFHGIIPYYASLGHRPFGFVLLHSISPLLPLVLVWLAVLTLLRPHLDWERAALAAGVLFGLLNCIVQQRALPYYRYPLLAFLLPLMALDFTRAFDSATETGAPFVTASSSRVGSAAAARVLATLALAFAGFFLAPQSAVLIHRYRWWQTDFISTLQANLNALGGPALSGRVQCIDSISGCGNVLYRMRLEPATGVLSDFLLFGAVSDHRPSGQIPILASTRAQFAAALAANPPQVIVVTSHLHIDGPDNFDKLARWPAFAQFLADRYTLRTEWAPTRTARWWSREETPASYRIYVLRSSP